ncbi:hypothetical protein SAMN04490179_5097 [Pseudomonas antarctica]|uniref:Uncharacterized protein n=1 Tax=Pseudomonas antarctica TaxID=219572 RepID=A0A1H0CWB2_9PSED|nr:hypothetical protein [Pseudomonas antarctica]SDN61941.1 hypothetical protein SAMN04490179_5097 [Pseudomonas antarctica]
MRRIKKLVMCSPGDDGYIDYGSSIVNIVKYTSRDKKVLRRAIKPKIGSGRFDVAAVQAARLITHEYTHYLDLTTTVWGLEFIVRRNLAYQAIDAGADIESKAVEVAMLNYAEILMHKGLVKVYGHVPIEDVVTKHSLSRNEKYGTIIMIHLMKGEGRIADVPVSMLSLLEANAVANELMGEALWIERVFGEVSSFHKNRISSNLDSIMKNVNALEYNAFHLLVVIHFPRLTIFDRLRLVGAVADFALNISGMHLSHVANTIFRSILNSTLRNALCNELCRGMSRQVVAFKVLLFIYQYTQENELSDEGVSEKLKSPLELICSALQYFGCDLQAVNVRSMSDFEYCFSVSMLRGLRRKFEPAGHVEAMLRNRRARKNTVFISEKFGFFKLPDLYLFDDKYFKMPNRQRFNLWSYYESIYDVYRQLNKFMNDPDRFRKQQLPLGFGPMDYLQNSRGEDQVD